MGSVIAVVLAIGAITAFAAKWATVRHPEWSAFRQIGVAVASFPVVTGVLVAIVVALQFVNRSPGEHSGQFGMPIFALLFMWFAVNMGGVLVSLPTALVAVRSFRG